MGVKVFRFLYKTHQKSAFNDAENRLEFTKRSLDRK